MSLGTERQYQYAPWMRIAEKYIGVEEIRGGENPVILKFFEDAGHPEIREDEVAWCSAFANAVFFEAGINGTKSLMAKSWLRWSGGARTLRPVFGDVVVFNRGSDPRFGHVAFFISWDSNYVTVLGGNQGRVGEVSVARMPRSRVAGFIHPRSQVTPIIQPTIPDMSMDEDTYLTQENAIKAGVGMSTVGSSFAANFTFGLFVTAVVIAILAYAFWKR